MAQARERTDLEPEDCRRLSVHTARDPRLDERARPAREVVERGRPDPPATGDSAAAYHLVRPAPPAPTTATSIFQSISRDRRLVR
jgi:hypothetical protein